MAIYIGKSAEIKNIITITGSNMTNYFTVQQADPNTSPSYGFTDANGQGAFVSLVSQYDSGSSIIKLTATVALSNITLAYYVNAGSALYTTLNIYKIAKGSTTKSYYVNNVSGSNNGTQENISLAVGDTLGIEYTKITVSGTTDDICGFALVQDTGTVTVKEVAHNVSKMYVGVGNIAHKVVKGYIGVNNIAHQFYPKYVASGTQLSTVIQHLGVRNQGGLYGNSTYSTSNYVGISAYTTGSWCKFRTPADYSSSKRLTFEMDGLDIQFNSYTGSYLTIFMEILTSEGGSRVDSKAYSSLDFYGSSSNHDYIHYIETASLLPDTEYYLAFRYDGDGDLDLTYGNEVLVTFYVKDLTLTYLT